MRFHLFMCVLAALVSLCPVLAPVLHGGDELDVLARARAQLDRIHLLPGICIEYRVDRESFLEKTAEAYAWPWSETKIVIRPRELGKVSLRLRYPFTYVGENGGGTLTREMTNDTEYLAMNNIGPGGGCMSSIHSVNREPFDSFGTWALYFRCIGYALTARPDDGVASRRTYPKQSYWLPEAIDVFRNQYALRSTREVVNGESCLVLERNGIDTIWVDPARDCAIVRRQFRWQEGNKSIRTDCIMSSFQEVSSKTWLPRTLVIDRYTAPWDDNKVQGKVASRLRLNVTHLDVSEVPDSVFRLIIPVGAQVQDNVSCTDLEKPRFFINQPGTDPFEMAISGDHLRLQWNRWVLFITLMAGCIVLIALVIWREKKRRRTRPTGA